MDLKIGDKAKLNRPFYLSATGVTIPTGTDGVVRELDEDKLTLEVPKYKVSVKLYIGEVSPVKG